MNPDLISQLADQVEGQIGSGGVWSIRIDPGDSQDKRQLIIDTCGHALQELRRRGYYDIRGTITRLQEDEPAGPNGELRLAGEYFCIGFAPEDSP